MTAEEVTKIYDRLLAMTLDISTGVVPDPAYINQKIGECHLYLGEVERFFINVSKEISVKQRALNNSMAGYEAEKDRLLTTRDDIRSLPNITEKLAKVNSMLKDSQKEIQGYESELVELNNLLKAVNHKHRNLVRANGDIKSLIKMVEAQIRLGTPTDPVAKGFMEEMRKGLDGEDSFKDAVTDAEESKTVDPTVPPNIQDLLVGGEEDSAEESVQEETEAEEQQEEEDSFNNLPEEVMREAEEALKAEPVIVDLESVLEPMGKGGEQAKDEPVAMEQPVPAPAEENPVPEIHTTKNPDKKIDGQMDLDDLLKQYT